MYSKKQRKSSPEHLKKQLAKTHRQFTAVGLAALAALLVGAVFYHYTDHLGWLDAFYFCTVTLTTIGYGDIAPSTDASKLFTIFYVIAGIGIMATFANLLIQNASAGRQYRRAARKVKRAPSDKE